MGSGNSTSECSVCFEERIFDKSLLMKGVGKVNNKWKPIEEEDEVEASNNSESTSSKPLSNHKLILETSEQDSKQDSKQDSNLMVNMLHDEKMLALSNKLLSTE